MGFRLRELERPIKVPPGGILVRELCMMPFAEGIELAEKIGKPLVSNKRLDDVVTGKHVKDYLEAFIVKNRRERADTEKSFESLNRLFRKREETLSQLKKLHWDMLHRMCEPIATGTIIAFAEPGMQLGHDIVEESLDGKSRTIFLVDCKYRRERDAALVIESPNYRLEKYGRDTIVIGENVGIITEFPAKKGWYRTDSKHRIPYGKETENPENRAFATTFNEWMYEHLAWVLGKQAYDITTHDLSASRPYDNVRYFSRYGAASEVGFIRRMKPHTPCGADIIEVDHIASDYRYGMMVELEAGIPP